MFHSLFQVLSLCIIALCLFWSKIAVACEQLRTGAVLADLVKAYKKQIHRLNTVAPVNVPEAAIAA